MKRLQKIAAIVEAYRAGASEEEVVGQFQVSLPAARRLKRLRHDMRLSTVSHLATLSDVRPDGEDGPAAAVPPGDRLECRSPGSAKTFYSTPCKWGHFAPRYANSGQCTICQKARDKKRDRRSDRSRQADYRRLIERGSTFERVHQTPLERSTPPDEVLAEARRAYAAPRTVTQVICGDPPLGRSSLDKKLGRESAL
jgi:hypothetical protein